MKKQQSSFSGTLKREFERDLELFKHFLLLLNDSGPIRNVELIWNEEIDPMKARYKNRVGTEDALVQLQPAGSPVTNRNSPSTLFCDLVHGFGAHEEETCARSDLPAQQRCRETRCSQVYACHVGLTDIAVPVMSGDLYLGTLFSGQVLTQAPTHESFARVSKTLKKHLYIDMVSLKEAYFQVPIVTEKQVTHMVSILELFARYIANSWERLRLMGEHQRQGERELALDRKELASMLLSGEIGERTELNDLVSRAGLHAMPDRILVVQIRYPPVGRDPRSGISDRMTLSRISHEVEDYSRNWPCALAMVVRPGEICIFMSQESRNSGHERLSLEEMAKAIMANIRARCGATARVGISASHPEPSDLIRAYQEACAALESGEGMVCFFNDPPPLGQGPMESLERLIQAMQRGENDPALLREYLSYAVPVNHAAHELQHSRALLTWAIEHIALEAARFGIDQDRLAASKRQASNGVLNAPSAFSACESLRRFVHVLTQEVASSLCQREQKIVHVVERLLEEKGIANITIAAIAGVLHLSSGHLSRVFRRTTGMTLEGYLIQKRVEVAKRLLLDPRLNVAEVAERCGFCNPAYFASVFKKYVKCTPREFATNPRPGPLGVPPVLSARAAP